MSTDDTVEDPAAFAMEKHLEDFLVENWEQTELGSQYDIFEEDGERVGQQFPTDTGRIDILATSKDKTTLLVVELKKGRASDHVVGQLLRYMGYVKEELLEEGQKVRGRWPRCAGVLHFLTDLFGQGPEAVAEMHEWRLSDHKSAVRLSRG